MASSGTTDATDMIPNEHVHGSGANVDQRVGPDVIFDDLFNTEEVCLLVSRFPCILRSFFHSTSSAPLKSSLTRHPLQQQLKPLAITQPTTCLVYVPLLLPSQSK
jgi:hypothetical protein